MAAALPPMIQQMLQPEFYPHPVTQPIQLLQTHISYVLLTGDYAYKVKKPAKFGFLDFSTLEQRQYFCQEELRLNRRLSPDLYLAVVPIMQRSESGKVHFALASGADFSGAGAQSNLKTAPPPLALEQSETIADYAVQMHQFPQECLFSQLFRRGELTVELIQSLGELVAVLHATAPTNAEIQAYGSVEAVRRVDDNNYALSQPFIGRCQTQTQFDQTRAFTDQFFADHADWLQQRQIEGKIRECHGDLHLNNVCLYQDKIQVFDCIEFNQDFRNIDVIYDLAFMVMDLEFHHRADLANVFLNTYLERTGDYWGAVLLPHYLSMRAYIRANVNALALEDAAIAPSDKQSFLDRAKAYYRLAWDYTQRPPGRLLLMSGLSGAGKSTVARQVAQQIKAIHIRSDAVRKHLAGIPLEQCGATAGAYGGGIYTAEMSQKTYDRLLSLGTLLAQQGWAVILDAKYDRQALRQAVIARAESLHIPLQILHCTAPIPVLRDRLQTRQGDITDATVDLLAAQQQAAEPFSAAEQAYVTTLKTDQDLKSQLQALAHPPQQPSS